MRTHSPSTVSIRYKRRRIDTDTSVAASSTVTSAVVTVPAAPAPAVTVTAVATATAAVRAPREEYVGEQLRGPYGNSVALRQALVQMQADMDAMGFSHKLRR